LLGGLLEARLQVAQQLLEGLLDDVLAAALEGAVHGALQGGAHRHHLHWLGAEHLARGSVDATDDAGDLDADLPLEGAQAAGVLDLALVTDLDAAGDEDVGAVLTGEPRRAAGV